MEFHVLLNQYIEETGCTARELAAKSGLSDSALSRYRSGQRVPSAGSEELERLLKALTADADPEQAEAMRTSLLGALPSRDVDRAAFSARFSALIDGLGISRSRLSAHVGYDPSFLSRVASGDRAPSDFYGFSAQVGSYIAVLCEDPAAREKAAAFLGLDEDVLKDPHRIEHAVGTWLTENTSQDGEDRASRERAAVENFLRRLDEFQLESYMRRIHFDKIKVPTNPVRATGSKHYFGSEGMKKAEIDYLKRTVFSASRSDIWMYSNLPMEKLAEDQAFTKKYMIGLAMAVKKGLHLNVIHDLDRPFEEMMMGLEGWLPLYMTGLIRPYYLRRPQDPSFRHLIRYAGVCALSGDCPGSDLESAVFFLTSRPSELPAMKRRKDAFFEQALPLMEIFPEGQEDAFRSVYDAELQLSEPQTVRGSESKYFKNIEIVKFADRCVMVSRESDPSIHFVIRHPKLVSAMQWL